MYAHYFRTVIRNLNQITVNMVTEKVFYTGPVGMVINQGH
jgi:hypothetical protein